MTSKKTSILKIFIFSYVLLFSNSLIYSQTLPQEQKKKKVNFTYGKKFKLKKNEEVYLKDSLSLILTSFSHKRPMIGGPTKATAYLSVSKGNVSDKLELSVHGTEGVSTNESYDSEEWNGYKFELKSLDYDRSIELIITIKK